jgi:hypothetical protein
MKGTIDREGTLFIERAGKMKGQSCPFSISMEWCGDWCPLFGEPENYNELGLKFEGVRTGIWIRLCQSSCLIFESLKDERGTPCQTE